MTNIITGIIIGFVFSIVAMILIGLWMDGDTAHHVKENIGEDFELVVIPKSKIEKVAEILDKENNDWYEIRTKNKS